MKAGDTVYFEDNMDLSNSKYILVEKYINFTDGEKQVVWVAKCVMGKDIYHKLILEEYLSTDSTMYDRQQKKQLIKEKIFALNQELRDIDKGK